jgi:hypothetical protein
MDRLPLVAVFACFLSHSAMAQSQRTWIIDFEGLTDSDATPLKLTDQYAKAPYSSYGVRFSIAGSSTLTPIVAVEGAPTKAFTNDANDSDPKFSSGSCAMTDAVKPNDISVAGDIQMDFDPPVTSLSFYIMDIDGSEKYTIRSYRAGTEVAALQQVLDASTPFVGDNISTLVRIKPASGELIDRVVIDTAAANPGGFAVDFVTFTRDCNAGSGTCPRPRISVSQESTAGASDFDTNVLGIASYFPSDTDVKSLYAYNVPDNDSFYGPQVETIVDRVHSWVTTTATGIALLTVYDKPAVDGGNGAGKAEVRIRFANWRGEGCTNVGWAVKDDPSDNWYTKDSATCSFRAKHSWNQTNSDGFALDGIDPTSSVYLSFDDVDNDVSTPAIQSLENWYWYSPVGTPIRLELGVGRRVRVNLVPPCGPDFNLDAFLTFEDFDAFVGYFESGADAADYNVDGFLTFEDFDQFVADFEAGC